MDDLGVKPTIFGNIHIVRDWTLDSYHVETLEVLVSNASCSCLIVRMVALKAISKNLSCRIDDEDSVTQ